MNRRRLIFWAFMFCLLAGGAGYRFYRDSVDLSEPPEIHIQFPPSFKTDGLGPLNYREFAGDRSELAEATQQQLNVYNSLLELNPKDTDTLRDAYILLRDAGHYGPALSFADRYFAAGGVLTNGQWRNYVKNLAQVARFDDAERELAAYEKLHPGFGVVGEAGVELNLYRCIYACRISHDLAAAGKYLIAMNCVAPSAPYMDEYDQVCAEVNRLVEAECADGSIDAVLPQLDDMWIFLPAATVRQEAESIKRSGSSPRPVMLDACDELNSGHTARPGGFIIRSNQNYRRAARVNDATAQALMAIESARKLANKVELLDALICGANIMHFRGELEQECSMAIEADTLAAEVGAAGRIARAKVALGLMYEQLAAYSKAADAYQEAMKIAAAHNAAWPLHEDPEALHSRVISQMGMADDAEVYLRSQAQYAERVAQGPGMLCVPFYNLGCCLSRGGKNDEAIVAFKRSMGSNDFEYRTASSVEVGNCYLDEDKPGDAEKAFDDAARYEKMVPNPERHWAWKFGKARARFMQHDLPGAKIWLEGALETIESQRASLLDYHHRTNLLDNKYEVYEFAIELALGRKDEAAAFDLCERSRARTFLDALGAKAAMAKPPTLVTLSTIQKSSTGFATVVFFQLQEEILAWIVREKSADLIHIPITASNLEALVRDFHVTLISDSDIKGPATSPSRSKWQHPGRKLYSKIWAPIERSLQPGERVCLIPHRVLHYTPFQALYDGTQFVVQKHDLFYAPSGSALAELRSRQHTADTGFAIFDPAQDKNREGVFSHTATHLIPPLFPQAVTYIREQATIAEFERSARTGLVHITAHGSFDPWIPVRSGLEMARPGGGSETLTAEHIYNLKMDHCDLVVLCSCVSSVGELAGGDEVTGVTRAFQIAGAQNVIGTLWPVEVLATEKLMGLYYEELKRTPLDPVHALCEAQRRYLKSDPDPSHWAAFELNGRGSR